MKYIIIIISYLFFNLYFIINGELIPGNPIRITNNSYPIIFKGNNSYYNIITSGKILKIEKSTREENTTNIDNYCPPFFIFKTVNTLSHIILLDSVVSFYLELTLKNITSTYRKRETVFVLTNRYNFCNNR